MSLPTLDQLAPYLDDGECHEWAPAVADAFGLEVHSGFYVLDDGRGADHSWCCAADGTIIDSTARQFGSPEIVRPEQAHYSRYVSYALDFERCVGFDAAAHGMSVADYKRYQGID